MGKRKWDLLPPPPSEYPFAKHVLGGVNRGALPANISLATTVLECCHGITIFTMLALVAGRGLACLSYSERLVPHPPNLQVSATTGDKSPQVLGSHAFNLLFNSCMGGVDRLIVATERQKPSYADAVSNNDPESAQEASYHERITLKNAATHQKPSRCFKIQHAKL